MNVRHPLRGAYVQLTHVQAGFCRKPNQKPRDLPAVFRQRNICDPCMLAIQTPFSFAMAQDEVLWTVAYTHRASLFRSLSRLMGVTTRAYQEYRIFLLSIVTVHRSFGFR